MKILGGERMYSRDVFKKIIAIVPETIASTATSTDYRAGLISSTRLRTLNGSSSRYWGANFSVTIEATTGAIYILPSEDAEPTSTNAFKLHEGNSIDLRVTDFLSIKGDSTTAQLQAIVWE
jgi:hypothetical protein